jgi:hypothetical protein
VKKSLSIGYKKDIDMRILVLTLMMFLGQSTFGAATGTSEATCQSYEYQAFSEKMEYLEKVFATYDWDNVYEKIVVLYDEKDGHRTEKNWFGFSKRNDFFNQLSRSLSTLVDKLVEEKEESKDPSAEETMAWNAFRQLLLNESNKIDLFTSRDIPSPTRIDGLDSDSVEADGNKQKQKILTKLIMINLVVGEFLNFSFKEFKRGIPLLFSLFSSPSSVYTVQECLLKKKHLCIDFTTLFIKACEEVFDPSELQVSRQISPISFRSNSPDPSLFFSMIFHNFVKIKFFDDSSYFLEPMHKPRSTRRKFGGFNILRLIKTPEWA